MSHIEELYVYGNRVNTLPHEIAHLKKLKKLALNENLLTDLPGNHTGMYVTCEKEFNYGLWGRIVLLFLELVPTLTTLLQTLL